MRYYQQVVENLCEHTTYTFSIDIINMLKINASSQVLPNISFLVNDESMMNTGDILQNEQWNRYSFSFTTRRGESKVKISLKNEVMEGTGNDFALDNLSLRPCGPIAEIQPQDTIYICEGETPVELYANLGEESINNWSLKWQRSLTGLENWEDIVSANQISYEHQESESGIYHYRYLLASSIQHLQNSNCRINSDITTIQIQPTTRFLEKTICEGNSFQLGDQYYTETGTYTANFISSIGCDSTIVLDLTVVQGSEIDATIEVESPSCVGNKDGKIEISNANSSYDIFLNDKLVDKESLDSLLAGTYNLLIRDSSSCPFEKLIQLFDPEEFRLDIDEYLEVNLGAEVAILPIVNQSVQQFFWQGCDNCSSDLSLRPIRSQIYTLTAISENGCRATDSIFIQVNSVGTLYIPNAFSPNNDGKNDFFSIFTSQSSVAEILQFSIFNRWGSIVFERRNLAATNGLQLWDGYVNGKRVVNGTYTCIAKIQLLDGKVEWISQQLTIVD